MSLSSGAPGGKGLDSTSVETYDSGDEWDIGVGNLIIDLDADLEKDQQKLEMSGSKEVGLPAPNAVATLPDNIKFVTPVPSGQTKESKSKSKRSKSGKDGGRSSQATGLFPVEASKKEVSGRSGEVGGNNSGALSSTVTSKGSEKSGKSSRSSSSSKKESGKTKKDKSEVAGSGGEKESSGVLQPTTGVGSRGVSLQEAVVASVEQLGGGMAVDSGSALNVAGIKTEPEDSETDSRGLKKVKSEMMESQVCASSGLPLHLLVPMVNSDISSPCEQIMVRTRSVGVNTSDVALATEPECLGPCEPGTSVNLEGIVWQETEDGMLVVNVTWRNKTYVGTLLDCTRHDWAPPRTDTSSMSPDGPYIQGKPSERFCDSPTSDLEMRNGRGRGKRMRPSSNAPIADATPAPDSKGASSSSSSSSKTRAGANNKGRRGSQNSSDHRPPPCGTTEDIKASPSSANKRKSKPPSDLELTSSSEDSKGSKRARTNSMGSSSAPVSVSLPMTVPLSNIKVEAPALDRNCSSPILIDCPHPNCNKKYKHINGLKYHQAHAHTDDDSKPEADGDSECGEEPHLHLDMGSCNGAFASQKGSMSPARSATPKARLLEPQSPPLSAKFCGKMVCKKKIGTEGDVDPGALSNDGSEDGNLAADDTSNDGFDSQEKRLSDKDSSKKGSSSGKQEKLSSSKSVKSARPIAPAILQQQMYTIQATTFTASSPGSSTGLTTTVVQAMPTSPQLKPIQPKPTVMGEPSSINPALTPSRDKKKKDKKKKETREEESSGNPIKPGRPEEGKSPYGEAGGDSSLKNDGLINGSESHQSRLASIKAEADKIYSFTDNAPSPSIGGSGSSSRMENPSPGQPMTPLHVVTQNGAEGTSGKTNSPAYSDISDAGEDGEGKMDSTKLKDPEQLVKEGAKKSLFPPQPQSKDSPYYQSFETYYSPNYAHSSPGAINPTGQATPENQPLKVKKEEDLEITEVKVMKPEPPEEKKPELCSTSQQPSVIQQRPNMYMQSLYYNQYAYVPPYGYSDQGYHAHLLSTNPTYRQQYEEHQKRQNLEQQQQQQRSIEKKAEMAMRDREASLKEEWKHKSSVPPTLTKAPSLTDLGKSGPSKVKELGPDSNKSVIIPKLEDSTKMPVQQAEGLKAKAPEGGGHSGKETAEAKQGAGECNRQAGLDPGLWYRPEADSRMWTYVYPKYPETMKVAEDERWKEERKVKEERTRSKEASSKEEGKEGMSGDVKGPSVADDPRVIPKDPRTSTHVPVSSPLTQHQSYIPYLHGYAYSQAYDPSHPSYRGMPAVMMQNYSGSYLPSSYSFSPYGNKVTGSEESEKSRASPSVSCKPTSESKALDILQQHASHYKSKSPTITDKSPQERDRGGCGVPGGSTGGPGCSSMGAPDRGGDRNSERPRSSPSQRLMSTHHHHHHLGYSLLPAQYQLPYAPGLSSTAIVASQQGSAPSLYPPPRR